MYLCCMYACMYVCMQALNPCKAESPKPRSLAETFILELGLTVTHRVACPATLKVHSGRRGPRDRLGVAWVVEGLWSLPGAGFRGSGVRLCVVV